jgi:hypothetical protein
MSMSPEQSLRHMLMSCVQQQLEHQVGPPLGSTSTAVTRYSESDSHKLADMIRLAIVAVSNQNNCTVTPEGLKDALLGQDFLGLGGALPVPAFMKKMFEVADPSLGPKSTPTCQGCTSPPQTPVAVNITVHQAPVAAGVQGQSITVGRITRQHPQGLGRQEERDSRMNTPVVARNHVSTPYVEAFRAAAASLTLRKTELASAVTCQQLERDLQ